MPLCTFVVPYDRFHGKILDAFGGSGQVAFSTPKAGNVSRKFVIPANPESANQTAIRGYLTAAAAAYQALSDTVANQWNAAANTVNRENILGLSYELSGIALYCMVNCYRQIDGQSIDDTVPSVSPPVQPAGSQSVGWDGAGPELSIAFTGTGLSDTDKLFVRVSPDLESAARKARRNDCRFISQTLTQCVADISSENGTVTMDPDNFTLAVGDNVGILATPVNSDYFPGTPLLVPNVAVVSV